MPSQNARTISFTNRHASLLDELVQTGRYQTTSEVVRDGLRALEAEIARDAAELEAIRERLRDSLDEANRGDFVEGSPEEVIRGAFEEARQQLSE